MGEWIDGTLIGDEAEAAVGGVDFGRGSAILWDEALDKSFTLEAILDDLLNRAHLEIVFLADGFELREAGHLAVFVDDLDEDSAGVQAGEAGQIDGAFGLTCADQDAAIASAEGIDVAGADEIVGGGFGIDEELDGLDAVGGGNAGADAVARVAIDADCERSAPHAVVARGLGRKFEAITVGGGEGDAEIAGADTGHEADDLRRDFLGSADEIAFVLAIFIIDEHDHFAGTKVGEDFGDWGEHF